MIGSLASFAISVGTTIAAWIEAAYVMDCAGPSAEETRADGQGTMSDLAWLPALSGVTVASAQAIQSHAARVNPESWKPLEKLQNVALGTPFVYRV